MRAAFRLVRVAVPCLQAPPHSFPLGLWWDKMEGHKWKRGMAPTPRKELHLPIYTHLIKNKRESHKD